MSDIELKKSLENLRDTCMADDCDYSDKQSKALQLIMSAIDALEAA